MKQNDSLKSLLFSLAKDSLALAREKARNILLKANQKLEEIRENDGLKYNTNPTEVVGFVENRIKEDQKWY